MTNNSIRTLDELGRASIPADQRQALGWTAQDKLIFTYNAQDGTVTISRAEEEEKA